MSEPTEPMKQPFAMLDLLALTIRRFSTKDELVNAMQDVRGSVRGVPLRYHEGAQQWSMMEVREW